MKNNMRMYTEDASLHFYREITIFMDKHITALGSAI